jgi:hypothetical protein
LRRRWLTEYRVPEFWNTVRDRLEIAYDRGNDRERPKDRSDDGCQSPFFCRLLTHRALLPPNTPPLPLVHIETRVTFKASLSPAFFSAANLIIDLDGKISAQPASLRCSANAALPGWLASQAVTILVTEAGIKGSSAFWVTNSGRESW